MQTEQKNKDVLEVNKRPSVKARFKLKLLSYQFIPAMG
jgi:hypothetical protein